MPDGTDSSAGRDQRGRFAPGNAGGPGGSRRRAYLLRRAAEEAITPEYIAAMIRKATRMGLEGDLAAMRLVFERTSGRPAEVPIEAEPLAVSLPRMRTARDCDAALERLTDALCKGDIDHASARLVVDVINARLKALELTELEGQLAALEKTAKNISTNGG